MEIKLKDYSPIENNLMDDCFNLQDSITVGNHHIICVNCNEDVEGKNLQLFNWYNDAYYTQGYVGVLYHNENKFIIGSRFDSGEEQYFLNYVFSKVFDVNGKIFEDMKISSKTDSTWDFLLIILYFQKLKKAFKSGLYKEYVTYKHNDSKVKGVIDIPRHIKENILFSGKVSYTTRENTLDNNINILILSTYKYIQKKYKDFAKSQVGESFKKQLIALENNVSQENLLDIKRTIKNTKKPVTRHIYKNYDELRIICRLILMRKSVNPFETRRNQVVGLVVNMPNLWEKFLEKTVLKQITLSDLKYFPQKTSLILENNRQIKPDFVFEDKDNNTKFILDAKYRAGWSEGISSDKIRDDVFQIMAYMYALQCNNGAAIFPSDKPKDIKNYKISDKCNGNFYSVPIYIPNSEYKKFSDFSCKFEEIIKDVSKEVYSNIKAL